jgi:hypothetical protein
MTVGRLAATCVALAITVPGTALASRVCADANLTFSDNGFGEDYWTADSNYFMPGVRIRVRHYNGCDFTGSSGYTTYVDSYAQTDGCTSNFSTSSFDSCWQVAVWSYGYPGGGNFLRAKNAGGSTEWWYINNVSVNSGLTLVVFPGIDSFRLYSAMGAAINWFRGALASTTLNVQASDDACVCSSNGTDVGSRYCVSGGAGYICVDDDDGDINRKFLMAHEFGHHNLWFTGGSWSSGSGCGGHSMTSQEQQSCALMEGWANFISAGVWNSFHAN